MYLYGYPYGATCVKRCVPLSAGIFQGTQFFFILSREVRMARPENLLTAKQVEAALRKGIPIQLTDHLFYI